jgi:integrase
LPDYLNPAEIYQLLDICKTKPVDALLIEFLIFTGLRISELKNLLIEDIDWQNHLLKVVRGKGGKDRYVPLTTNLQSKLLLYLQGRTRGWVFCKKNQTIYTTRALEYRISYWLHKLQLPKKLSTHSLRHTFACLCLARGLSIYQVKDLLGHSSIKVTEIYGKLGLDHIKSDFLRLMDYRG